MVIINSDKRMLIFVAVKIGATTAYEQRVKKL